MRSGNKQEALKRQDGDSFAKHKEDIFSPHSPTLSPQTEAKWSHEQPWWNNKESYWSFWTWHDLEVFVQHWHIFNNKRRCTYTHKKEVSFQEKWYSKTLIVIQALKLSSMCMCDRSHRRGSFEMFCYKGNKKSCIDTRAWGQTRASLQNGSIHGKPRAYQRGWEDQSTLNANVMVVKLLYPPFLHSLQGTHLHSESTAHMTNIVLIKHLIQIPFYSAGKK